MAERLATGQHEQLRTHPGRPTPDFSEEWFNGDTWRLVRGKDFDSLPSSFGRFLRGQAHKYGKKLTVNVIDSETIVICAVSKDGEK